MARQYRPLAVVTGASTGIGYELAKCCAKNGFDLIVADDEPKIFRIARRGEGQRDHCHLLDAGRNGNGCLRTRGPARYQSWQSKKDDPADVAATGFKAMMNGDGDIVSGWQNKLQTAIASVTPAAILAEQHRRQAAPGSATN